MALTPHTSTGSNSARPPPPPQLWQFTASSAATASTIHAHRKNSDEQETIAVCLWGPPGCGKSSAIAQIQLLINNDNPICVFNTDFWMDYWIQTVFSQEHEHYIKEHERVLVHGTEEEQAEERLQANTFKREIRFLKIKAFVARAMAQKCPDFPHTMYEMLYHFFIRNLRKVIDLSEWEQFVQMWSIHHQGENIEETLSTTEIFLRFGVWWSKQHNRKFILEMSGRDLGPDAYLEYCFGGAKNMLYIPFVYDVRILEARVAGRAHQFGNPTNKVINEAFAVSYGPNLLKAMDRMVFDLILFQSNATNYAYIMMSLERVLLDGAYCYVLTKEQANDLHEALYVQQFLHALCIPPHMHNTGTLVFDVAQRRWRCHESTPTF